MENGALHVARGTLGDRNASQRCQMDPKGRPKGANGTQNGAKGCKKGAKGSQNEQKVSQVAPTCIQIGSKFGPDSTPKSIKTRFGEKGAKKVPKHRNYNSISFVTKTIQNYVKK